MRTEADGLNGFYVQVKHRIGAFRAHEKPQLSGRSALSVLLSLKNPAGSHNPASEEICLRDVKQLEIVET